MANTEKKTAEKNPFEIDYDRLRVTQSDEYRRYIYGLFRMSSHWVAGLRVQYAEKAYEMYQNPTVRQIVDAYLQDIEKQDERALDGFLEVSKYPNMSDEDRLYHVKRDTVLLHPEDYAQTIYMLFGIHHV